MDKVKHFLNLPTLSHQTTPYNPKTLIQTLKLIKTNKTLEKQQIKFLLEQAQEQVNNIPGNSKSSIISKIEQEDCNMKLYKQLILNLYETQKYNECIQELLNYLDVFSMDVEAIHFLQELYLRKRFFKQYKYLCAECILIRPDSVFEIKRYADVCFAIGEFEEAFLFYLKTVDLVQNLLQGWQGVYYCAKALGKSVFVDLAIKRILMIDKSDLMVRLLQK
jgi:tetratricopeptide (TPR) repeat protein